MAGRPADARRWTVLAVGLLGLIAGCAAPLAFVIGLGGGRAAGYALAFSVVVIFPFVAFALIPAGLERLPET